MIRATNGFDSFPDADLLAKASYILLRMTDNEACPSPTPTLAVFGDLIKGYSEALAAAGTRSIPLVSAKNAKRAELVLAMRQIGNYVTLRANGSAGVIVSAGFEASRPRTTPEPLQTPNAPTMATGANPGSLMLTTSAQPATLVNRFFVTDDPQLPMEQWQYSYTARSKQEFVKLKSGTRYYAKVQQIGRDSFVESPMSTYVTQ